MFRLESFMIRRLDHERVIYNVRLLRYNETFY